MGEAEKDGWEAEIRKLIESTTSTAKGWKFAD